MGTTKMKTLLMICVAVFVVFVSLKVYAARSDDPNMQMEACVSCATPSLNNQALKVNGIDGLQHLQANPEPMRRPSSDDQKKDPRVVVEPQPSCSGIGYVMPNQKLTDPSSGITYDVDPTGQTGLRGTAWMFSPCHIFATYHSEFGSSTKPDTVNFSSRFF